MRTGASASKISRKPSLLWVTEVGPSVSSPIFVQGTIYVSTITGRIFALNPSEKQIKWHLNVGSPVISSPLLHNGILVAATYDSWIKGTSFTGKKCLELIRKMGSRFGDLKFRVTFSLLRVWLMTCYIG
jgi:hypothetical protein